MAPTLAVLQDSGIEIEGDPQNITQLPPNARELRDMLLNFERVMPFNRKINIQSYLDRDNNVGDPEVRPPDTIYCESGHPVYLARWTAAEELRNKARDLGPDHSEDDWKYLMSSFVFQAINSQASDHGIPMRDLLSWVSDQPFTNAISIRGLLDDDQPHQPKPDFCFGLGLYNEEQLSRLRGLELSDKGIKYFTQKGLKEISTFHPDEFVCQPVKSKEYAAFPWMVAELKKQNEKEPYCLRQAANASHTCLVLCEQLAKKGARDGSPIVAFTSIGPEAKVFITYRSKNAKNPCCRMSCIWSGHMGEVASAIQLRCIVDRLLFWALRIFKPWVTECLEHWQERETSEEHKSTHTLGDDQISPTPRARSQFLGNRSESKHSSRSDAAGSPRKSTLPVPTTRRSKSSTSEARSGFHARNQSATNRSHRSYSSGTESGRF